MQVRSDANYYRSRAEEERAAAEAAAGKESRELHLSLAAAYERAALREASGATGGRDDPEQESWLRPMAVIPHANASWRDPDPGK